MRPRRVCSPPRAPLGGWPRRPSSCSCPTSLQKQASPLQWLAMCNGCLVGSTHPPCSSRSAQHEHLLQLRPQKNPCAQAVQMMPTGDTGAEGRGRGVSAGIGLCGPRTQCACRLISSRRAPAWPLSSRLVPLVCLAVCWLRRGALCCHEGPYNKGTGACAGTKAGSKRSLQD